MFFSCWFLCLFFVDCYVVVVVVVVVVAATIIVVVLLHIKIYCCILFCFSLHSLRLFAIDTIAIIFCILTPHHYYLCFCCCCSLYRPCQLSLLLLLLLLLWESIPCVVSDLHFTTGLFFVVFSALEELFVDLVIGIQRKFFDGFVAIGKARQKHDERRGIVNLLEFYASARPF